MLLTSFSLLKEVERTNLNFCHQNHATKKRRQDRARPKTSKRLKPNCPHSCKYVQTHRYTNVNTQIHTYRYIPYQHLTNPNNVHDVVLQNKGRNLFGAHTTECKKMSKNQKSFTFTNANRLSQHLRGNKTYDNDFNVLGII